MKVRSILFVLNKIQWTYSIRLPPFCKLGANVTSSCVPGKWCPRREWPSPADARAVNDARRGVLYSSVFLGSPGEYNGKCTETRILVYARSSRCWYLYVHAATNPIQTIIREAFVPSFSVRNHRTQNHLKKYILTSKISSEFILLR